MKIYVCWGTWTVGKPLHAHPCGEAHAAVVKAGYEPEVIRSYGLGLLPGAINGLTRGRREVRSMTGNDWVPVLVLDDETVIQGSKKIIAWAAANPAQEPEISPTGATSTAAGSGASPV
ncbi:MAG TPA: hypothetical protein VGG87_08515 [Solirubrobacteraceae bacterium]